MAKVKNICINDAKLIFRNFKGKGDKFNPEGRRTFGVVLDSETAQDLQEEGWHVKFLKPRDDEEEPTPYLPIRVNYKTIPPQIYMVTKKKKTLMDESTVGTLDNAELKEVDLVISPYNWEMANGDSGITAYLKTGYFTIVEDPFYEKYAKYDDPSSEEEIPFE